ncbi:MAG: hypothetical protein IIT61_00865, partial [Bacteroidales bacterium]|nr:hypothetical protein [Bacteroidales bacterium]
AGVLLTGLSSEDWDIVAVAVAVEFVVCSGLLGFCPNAFTVTNAKVVQSTIMNNFLISYTFILIMRKNMK